MIFNDLSKRKRFGGSMSKNRQILSNNDKKGLNLQNKEWKNKVNFVPKRDCCKLSFHSPFILIFPKLWKTNLILIVNSLKLFCFNKETETNLIWNKTWKFECWKKATKGNKGKVNLKWGQYGHFLYY